MSPSIFLRFVFNKKYFFSRYEGFAIDLAAALAEKLHFNFTFKIVDDGKV